MSNEDHILIGHFHDGNVWIVKDEFVDSFCNNFNMKLNEIGEELGLQYEQTAEFDIIQPLPGFITPNKVFKASSDSSYESEGQISEDMESE